MLLVSSRRRTLELRRLSTVTDGWRPFAKPAGPLIGSFAMLLPTTAFAQDAGVSGVPSGPSNANGLNNSGRDPSGIGNAGTVGLLRRHRHGPLLRRAPCRSIQRDCLLGGGYGVAPPTCAARCRSRRPQPLRRMTGSSSTASPASVGAAGASVNKTPGSSDCDTRPRRGMRQSTLACRDQD